MQHITELMNGHILKNIQVLLMKVVDFCLCQMALKSPMKLKYLSY